MLEIVLVLLFLVVGAVLVFRRTEGTSRRSKEFSRNALVRLAALGAAVGAIRVIIWYTHSQDAHAQATRLAAQLPHQVQERGYISSQSCQACHPGHFDSWHASYHRTMTQPATPAAVVGDFDSHRVAFDGIDYLLLRRGNGYWAQMTQPGSGTQEVQLVMTTGSHHYQVYWMGEGPDRSLIEFPLAWLIEDRRWIPREAALVMPPHLKQQAVLWNGICIRCHSTHSQPRIEMTSQHADTSVAELGISCEACHGPAEAHVRANQNPARRYGRHLTDEADPTILNPARLSAERSSQVCGQCHAIASFGTQQWWQGHWNAFQPGQDLHATRNVIQPTRPETLGDLKQALAQNPDYLIGHYWRDGMVRVSGREYNGLIESPCFQGGKFSCLSCHSMHDSDPNDQLAKGMLDDQACLQCHEDYRQRAAEHSHHAANSAGSRCYNCHMPYTSYGLLKAIRSHQVSSPSVSASIATGRPNACNQCHLDKSLGWTQEHLSSWYGIQPQKLDEDQARLSEIVTMLLRGDAGRRALAAWSMGWSDAHVASGNQWQTPFLAQLLIDPYPAVRYLAVRSLRRLPGFENFEYDFVGPEAGRRDAQQRALQLWEQQRSQRTLQTGDSILIDSSGTLNQATFDRLLRLRDNRDIDLKE